MDDLVNAVARGIGVEIFSERHGCLCDHATEDLQMNVRGHISLPAIARAAIAAYEAAQKNPRPDRSQVGEVDDSEPCRGNGGDALTDRARPVRNSAKREHEAGR